MNTYFAEVKGFVKANQTKILVTTAVVATGVAVLMRMGLNSHDEFLREHNLYETYYHPDADE